MAFTVFYVPKSDVHVLTDKTKDSFDMCEKCEKWDIDFYCVNFWYGTEEMCHDCAKKNYFEALDEYEKHHLIHKSMECWECHETKESGFKFSNGTKICKDCFRKEYICKSQIDEF